jgi:hypothetical protein
MPNKFDTIHKISKRIFFPSARMVVKHIVIANSTLGSKTRKMAFKTGNEGLHFGTEDYLSLEEVYEYGKRDPDSICRSEFSYIDAPLVIRAMDASMRWFTDPATNMAIWEADEHGQPKTIKMQKRESVPLVGRSFGGIKFFAIEPTIVYDAAVNGTAYQGVKLACERGAIGSLTIQEYYATVLSLKYLLLNLATSSNSLLMLALIYMLGDSP